MPLVPIPTNENAAPEAKAIFQAMEAKLGMVPSIFRAMGHAPAVLQHTLGLNDAIKTNLDPKLRELAYLKASQINNCGYCTHYHKIFAKKAGLTEAQVNDLARFADSAAYDDLQKAVLKFAEEWTKLGKASPAIVEKLKARLNPTEMITLAATVGMANWTNRFNETFGMELP